MKTMKHFLINRHKSSIRVLFAGLALVSCMFVFNIAGISQDLEEQTSKIEALDAYATLAKTNNVNTLKPTEEIANTENPSFYAAETDKPMDLENWMTDDVFFGAYNSLYKVEEEPDLELEDWMLDESHFCLHRYNSQKVVEENLQSTSVDFN